MIVLCVQVSAPRAVEVGGDEIPEDHHNYYYYDHRHRKRITLGLATRMASVSASQAALCVACHGVRSHAVPVALVSIRH